MVSLQLPLQDARTVVSTKVGQISKVNPSTNRVLVAGINMIKKATKPNPQTGEEGGMISKEATIHASNVMMLDPKTNKPTRKRPA